MSGYMGGGGDNLTSLYLSNPAMAQALRKQQMGLEMAQSWKPQGPVLSPWQGVDSLVKGLMGAYLFNKGNDDIQTAHDKGNADLADAMNKAYGGGGQTAPAQPQAPQMPPQMPSPQASGGSSVPGLGASESGNNPGAVNPGGYAGTYQMGKARMADLGFYKPAPGENMSDNKTWAGQVQVAPYNVTDRASFLASPQAQGAVQQASEANVDQAIAKTPGADKLDRNGLQAVAHLGGVTGMQRFVTSGGTYDPADANGTHLSDYYQRFAGSGGPRGVAARTGGVDVAGPGAPTAPQGQMPQQQMPQAPPPTGQNAPMVQEALRLQQQATQLMIDHPGDPRFHALAQGMMQRAQTLAGLDTYTTGPDGTQRNVRTGEAKSAATPAMNYKLNAAGTAYESPGNKPEIIPTGRTAQDVHGNTWIIGAGGQAHMLAPNPTGIKDDSERIIAELGPKIRNGTATQQELDTYNTVANKTQNFGIHTDPSTGALIRAPQNPLPPGMPQPGGGAGGAVPITGGSRGPQSAQDVTTNVAKKDLDAASEEQAAAMKSHDILGTTATIRATAPQVTTGAGGDARLKAAQIFTALGVDPKIAQSWTGTNAAPGEVLQKKLFELSTGATRAMGAREPGSVMMMFQKNYPGMGSRDMTIDSMTRLIDMDQQYKEDETAARSAHLHGAVEGMANGQSYQGLSGYSQPNPRMYQAAALASGGMPFSVWSQGLTPQQQAQALKLAGRVYPDATALDKNGVMHKFGGGQ